MREGGEDVKRERDGTVGCLSEKRINILLEFSSTIGIIFLTTPLMFPQFSPEIEVSMEPQTPGTPHTLTRE